MKLRVRFSGLALAGFLVAAPTDLRISMDQVMTGEQLRTSGVDGLTVAQRAALDRWLSEYTLRVIESAQGANDKGSGSVTAAAYTGPSGGHWIRSKADNGALLTLEDGSIWEISSIDRIDTSLWLPVTNITVLRATSPVGDYKYTLLNTDDGEKALAKFLGR